MRISLEIDEENREKHFKRECFYPFWGIGPGYARANVHRQRHRGTWAGAAIVLAAAGGSSAKAADPAPQPPEYRSFGQALAHGEWGVGLRYRFEDLHEDAFDEDGLASTLRTVLSYRSGAFHGLDLKLVFQNVTDIGLADDHNNVGAGDSSNGVTDRPTIADPALTDVYQAWAGYHGLPDTDLLLGRQAIALGDERYVGPVGWRQNHQSFDAFRVDQRSIPRTRITYAYVQEVNTVTGAHQGMSTNLVDVEVRVAKAGRVTPYYYRLDYDDSAQAALSTETLGARWQNEWKPGGAWSFPYLVELATQRDVGSNPNDVHADYGRIELTAARKRWWLRAGYEVLGGSVADGRFTTPLATLHKFNGWADKFGNTPDNGLRDLSVAAGGRWDPFDAQLILHDFRSDSAGLDYGTELDGQFRYTAPWKQVFALELALYDAQDYSTDTRKLWLWTSYRFGPGKE